jgi:hypothetical protein
MRRYLIFPVKHRKFGTTGPGWKNGHPSPRPPPDGTGCGRNSTAAHLRKLRLPHAEGPLSVSPASDRDFRNAVPKRSALVGASGGAPVRPPDAQLRAPRPQGPCATDRMAGPGRGRPAERSFGTPPGPDLPHGQVERSAAAPRNGLVRVGQHQDVDLPDPPPRRNGWIERRRGSPGGRCRRRSGRVPSGEDTWHAPLTDVEAVRRSPAPQGEVRDVDPPRKGRKPPPAPATPSSLPQQEDRPAAASRRAAKHRRGRRGGRGSSPRRTRRRRPARREPASARGDEGRRAGSIDARRRRPRPGMPPTPAVPRTGPNSTFQRTAPDGTDWQKAAEDRRVPRKATRGRGGTAPSPIATGSFPSFPPIPLRSSGRPGGRSWR